MAVVAYINELDPQHGVLADCRVKLDDKYTLRVGLMRRMGNKSYYIQSAALDRLKFTALGCDFEDLRERITDAVAASYEKALRFHHDNRHRMSFAVDQNMTGMELERVEREQQQYNSNRVRGSFRRRDIEQIGKSPRPRTLH